MFNLVVAAAKKVFQLESGKRQVLTEKQNRYVESRLCAVIAELAVVMSNNRDDPEGSSKAITQVRNVLDELLDFLRNPPNEEDVRPFMRRIKDKFPNIAANLGEKPNTTVYGYKRED